MRVTVLAGGFGGSKLAHGFALLGEDQGTPLELSVIVNVGDDFEIHGLRVSPDLDTVTYTLAGLANPDTGWGIRADTWSAAAMLERYGAPTWFRLGDADLATSLLRTERLRAGARLSEVTADLTARLAIPARIIPASDDAVATQVRTDEGWLDFQDYFVRRRHEDDVRELRYAGIESARPSPEALAAIAEAELIALAPSNPFLSLDPILGLGGMLESIERRGVRVVGVSPIVGGKALRGPADRIFVSLGGEASAFGVARHYADRYPGLLDGLAIDIVDADQAPAIEALGLMVLVTDTVMRSDEDRARLAEEVLEFGRAPAR
jgi:LPPG:FO 2-phospho-L-lactate transferase